MIEHFYAEAIIATAAELIRQHPQMSDEDKATLNALAAGCRLALDGEVVDLTDILERATSILEGLEDQPKGDP